MYLFTNAGVQYDFRIRQMTFVSFNNNNTNSATLGAGNANHSGAHEFSPDLCWCFTSIATMLSIPEHLGFYGVHVHQSLFFCVVFCRSLYILLPLAMHCLSFELRFLITPLVSSNFSMKDW